MSPQESRCQPAVSEKTQVNDFALAVHLLEAIQLFVIAIQVTVRGNQAKTRAQQDKLEQGFNAPAVDNQSRHVQISKGA